MDDWNDAQCDADVLTQVLAASQQEYLDSLKTAKESETSQSRRNSSEDSNQEVEHRAPSGGNNNGNYFIFWSPYKRIFGTFLRISIKKVICTLIFCTTSFETLVQ